MTGAAWLVPTIRATRWSTFAVAATAGLGVVTARPLVGPWSALVFAAVIAGALVAVADTAGEFLRVMPVSALRRAVRRTAVVAAPAAPALAGLAAASGSAPRPLALAALGAVGVAALAALPAVARAGEIAGAVVIMWVAGGALASEAGAPAEWAMVWWYRPLPVLAIGVATALVSLSRQ